MFVVVLVIDVSIVLICQRVGLDLSLSVFVSIRDPWYYRPFSPWPTTLGILGLRLQSFYSALNIGRGNLRRIAPVLSNVEFWSSALICGLGISVAGVYFLSARCCGSDVSPWWSRFDNAQGRQVRTHRRNLGMAVMVVVSAATFLGVNLMDHQPSPIVFGYYWLVVLLMIAWLCLIALADIRHTLRLHRTWRNRRSQASAAPTSSLEQYLDTHRRTDTVRHRRGGSP